MIALRHRARVAVVLCVVASATVACGPAAVSPTPAASASQAPSASIAPTIPPSPSPTAVPTASPSPAVTPVASPSVAACLVLPQTGPAPSDRLTGIDVLGLPGRDIVRFVFGAGSLTPAGPPTETISVAKRPLTEGPSGRPIDLQGKQALQVVFRGMSLQNDVGQPTFAGERRILVDQASRSLRDVVIFDESEGQIGWFVGYEASSCLSLSREGDDLVLSIDYGPG